MTSPPPPSTTVFFQDKCLSHRYMRSPDTSLIFERPQRLRAVKVGVAAAIARLEQRRRELAGLGGGIEHQGSPGAEDVLAKALEKLNLAEGPSSATGIGIREAIDVVMSTASVDLLTHPAVKYIHGDIDGDIYLQRLDTLIRESEEKAARGESEIPEGLSQTDLYLCAGSLDAIQGAVGTVCEAVDVVMGATRSSSDRTSLSVSRGPSRAFVAIRPPGHHCGGDTPSGFCFVNNVAIAAAHAHLKHGVTRAVVLDIDLHHGNGTQAIVWRINEEAYRQQLESVESDTARSQPLQVYYGSIHDPLSYPCEGGNAAIVQAASVSLHGPHGQHIENVHLLPYESEADFWDRLYDGPYARLLQEAAVFLGNSTGLGKAIVFISAGFDASEHETASMSRHGSKLPTGFFRRFARDVRTLADMYAEGRIVSVLEGGYSDRALCSGAMAHVLGLAEVDAEVDESWWSVENLVKMEKATKKRRGGRTSTTAVVNCEKWIERTLSLLSTFDPNPSPPPTPKPIPPSTMTLRDRSRKAGSVSPSPSVASPVSRSSAGADTGQQRSVVETGKLAEGDVDQSSDTRNLIRTGETVREAPVKKLPRVLLRVNKPGSAAS